MWRIPLSDLNYDEAEEQAVLSVLRSRWLTMGPKTEEFEATVADYLGVKHAVAVANCTCALQLAYACLIMADDVMVPDITFAATANAAYAAGGYPVIADIRSPDVALLSAETVRERTYVTGGLRTVCTMHYAGFDSGVEDMMEVAAEKDLYIVEDAAHAIGGLTKSSRKLGSIGDVGCFSFFSNKNMATGEGGLLVTNDDSIARRVRLTRSHGMSSLTFERHQSRVHGYDILQSGGHNFRCTEITAALAIEQLKKLDDGNRRRRKLYRLYRDLLATCEFVSVMCGDDDAAIEASACHILPLVCATTVLRDGIRDSLDAASIQTSHHYRPLHQFPAFSGTSKIMQCPNAVSFSERELTLPLHPKLSEASVEEICEIVIKTAGNVSA